MLEVAEPICVAYADPPYMGQSKKHYSDHPDYAGEVDHKDLIRKLRDEFPDGWALSLHSPSTQLILGYCADLGLDLMRGDIRLMAWVKPFAVFKPNVNPAYAWEPIIVCGGRKRTRQQRTERDWVSCNITLKRGLVGAKPEGFSLWLFEVLGLRPGDDLIDLFPGSNAVSEAWRNFCSLPAAPESDQPSLV